MTPLLLVLLLTALAVAFAAVFQRQAELRRQHAAVHERAEARSFASADAQPLQLPVVDLQKCLGCGTCVRECPEEGVLALVHGQAAVVNPAGCVGHARCVSECPVDAVTLRTADASTRDDVPALDGELQAVGQPGLFLVGEITARALIRTATTQGAAVGRRIGEQLAGRSPGGEVLDAVVVGAGPGGIACALALREAGCSFTLIDREHAIGGTVARYPRHKLVLTDVVDLPLHGRLPTREYRKEELITLWQRLVDEHQLPFRGGLVFDRLERDEQGVFVVHTDEGVIRARNVVLAVGRRGTPRRLGVVGEELPHVSYSLLDAASYRDRRVVVVGGGDSAAEAALALAEQPGNRVTIVHRRDAFLRLRSKNRRRLEEQVAAGAIDVCRSAKLTEIRADQVAVAPVDADGAEAAAVATATRIPCDDVLVMVGGVPPFEQLRACGVSFDAEVVAANAPTVDEGGGGRANLLFALGAALLCGVLTMAFTLWHADYYFEQPALRAADPKHALLRPDRGLGLWFGLGATAAVLLNLAYLLRRQQLWGVRFGRLSLWMNAHVATGVIAVLLVMLHAALSPRGTPGGYAFWGLVALLGTGAIGRWFYAWLPRAANGREQRLDELRRELNELREQRAPDAFAVEARELTAALVERRQWRGTWSGRVLALLGLQWDLWRARRRMRKLAQAHGADAAALARELHVAGQAHRHAVAAAHLDDLRAVLATWRWLHRWLALLMVLLLVVHVVVAALHGAFAGGLGL